MKASSHTLANHASSHAKRGKSERGNQDATERRSQPEVQMQGEEGTVKAVAFGVTSYIVSAAVALVVVLVLKVAFSGLPLVVGAILGTGVAAMTHGKSTSTAGLKTMLSIAFGICAVVFVSVAQWLAPLASFPVVTMVMGAIGSAIFPHVLFDKFSQSGTRN